MESREVQDAVGEAPPRQKSLEQEAAELRRIVEAPSEKERAAVRLAQVERQNAARTEDEGREAARERIVAINRAAGSLITQQAADEKKLADAARAYAAAAEIVTERYRQIEKLRAESDALVDRFGIEPAKIPNVVPPGRRELIVQPHRSVAGADLPEYASVQHTPFEDDEYGLRKRRTYAEVAGTEAYRIISAAGLKTFRPLTPKEQAAVESQKDGATVSGMEMVEGELQKINALPPGFAASRRRVSCDVSTRARADES